jgi:hypothetical protein
MDGEIEITQNYELDERKYEFGIDISSGQVNQILVEGNDDFHEEIREAIFNKHFYKYDNDHHLNYINLVVPIIKLHIKNSPMLIDYKFEYTDDIVRPEIDIHKYMVLKKG